MTGLAPGSARFVVGDVFECLADIADGTVDLVVTSPPFLALRSYLPADHPDKDKEIGMEADPAAFIDTLLRLTAELSRVLAPHGSIAVELGDTYAGSGGSGGDYSKRGWKQGQNGFMGSAARAKHSQPRQWSGGDGWPNPKSMSMIPEAYRMALAYGFNPLNGNESPAGKWLIRNVVTWCRPNPQVGALVDKWRPATSDVVIATLNPNRFWDDLATRRPGPGGSFTSPLRDWWEVSTAGYPGSHYATMPTKIASPIIKALTPTRVCVRCGEPSRPIIEPTRAHRDFLGESMYNRDDWKDRSNGKHRDESTPNYRHTSSYLLTGHTDCGHNHWRPSLVLDPFAGTGTTLAVATGHGHTAIGIDIDERNAALAQQRVGPLQFEAVPA